MGENLTPSPSPVRWRGALICGQPEKDWHDLNPLLIPLSSALERGGRVSGRGEVKVAPCHQTLFFALLLLSAAMGQDVPLQHKLVAYRLIDGVGAGDAPTVAYRDDLPVFGEFGRREAAALLGGQEELLVQRFFVQPNRIPRCRAEC